MLLNPSRVLSSKTVRPRASCGARCMGHAIRMWSAVCSAALHLQFGEGARPHLYIVKWNRPTQLSLTLALRSKLIPTGLVLVLGLRTRILEVFSQYSVSSKGWVKSWQLRRINVGSASDLCRICVGFASDLCRSCAGLRGILTLTLTLTLTPTSSIPRQSNEVALKYNLCRATKLRV